MENKLSGPVHPLDGIAWQLLTRRSCIRTTKRNRKSLSDSRPRTAVAPASYAAFAMAVGSLASIGVATVELVEVGLPRQMADLVELRRDLCHPPHPPLGITLGQQFSPTTAQLLEQVTQAGDLLPVGGAHTRAQQTAM